MGTRRSSLGSICLLGLTVMTAIFGGCGGDPGGAQPANRVTSEICDIQLEKNRVITPDSHRLRKVLFTDFERTEDGTVYLLDGRNVKIYMFGPAGNLRKIFLAPGSGPGEFGPHPKLQILNQHLWVLGIRKIGKFTLAGDLMAEFKLKNYYRSKMMVDNLHFVATLEVRATKENGSHKFNKQVGLVNLPDESLHPPFIEAPDIGTLVVKLPEKRVMSIIPGPRILTDLIYTVDTRRHIVYYANSSSYTIHKQRLDSRESTGFSVQYAPPPFSKEGKRYIAESIRDLAPEVKKQIAGMLPDFLPAIHEIRALDSGHFMVRRVTGVKDSVCDILAPGGRFLCTARFAPELSPRRLKIYGATIAIIDETDESNLYCEYRIANYQQVFGK